MVVKRQRKGTCFKLCQDDVNKQNKNIIESTETCLKYCQKQNNSNSSSKSNKTLGDALNDFFTNEHEQKRKSQFSDKKSKNLRKEMVRLLHMQINAANSDDDDDDDDDDKDDEDSNDGLNMGSDEEREIIKLAEKIVGENNNYY